MLECSELLISLLGAWITATVGYLFLKRRRKNKLPKGVIIVDREILIEENKRPGS